MKKLLCLLLAATLLFGAAACGKPQNTAPVNSPVSTPGAESSTDTAGRVLVLYFSATGSTKAVAEYIACRRRRHAVCHHPGRAVHTG